MATSGRLRAVDVRAVYELVGECRELGDDPGRWRDHLLRGLARLTGAGLGMECELARSAAVSWRPLGFALVGMENGFHRARWDRVAEAAARDPDYHPIRNAWVPRLAAADAACLARPDLIADRDWYGSDYFEDIHRVLGGDATLSSYARLPGRPGEYFELYLVRPLGEPEFRPRDRAVVAAAVGTVVGLVGAALAGFTDPSPAALPPRAREVLRCLLEGDSDKQAAARLGLTRNTVNQYAKRIFAHFGVRSRAELLARWVRRGWASGYPWADPAG